MVALIVEAFVLMALCVGLGVVLGVMARRTLALVTGPSHRPAFAPAEPEAHHGEGVADHGDPAVPLTVEVERPSLVSAQEQALLDAAIAPAEVVPAATPGEGITDPDKAAAADQVGLRPEPLAGPRDGKADDLKAIRGIGPQNEARLQALGIFHLDQIASWSADEARWVGTYLAFPGRIEREDWIGQAKRLTAPAAVAP